MAFAIVYIFLDACNFSVLTPGIDSVLFEMYDEVCNSRIIHILLKRISFVIHIFKYLILKFVT